MSVYSWYNRADRFIVVVLIVAALLITGGAIFIKAEVRSLKKEQNARYVECKARTIDLEWCIRQVYGVDVQQ